MNTTPQVKRSRHASRPLAEKTNLAWFCAAVFLWELMEQSASHPGLATTISEELQVKDHMMQNARPERTQ